MRDPRKCKSGSAKNGHTFNRRRFSNVAQRVLELVIGKRRFHNGRFSVGAKRQHKVSQRVQTCLTQRAAFGSRV